MSGALQKITQLKIDEVSLVDQPANALPGWIIVKSLNPDAEASDTPYPPKPTGGGVRHPETGRFVPASLEHGLLPGIPHNQTHNRHPLRNLKLL